ncbi:PAS domain-containing sensor histidine kinase [Caulobacter sp. RL271]|jgi:signal transduction histidine kinase|uniref:histidine kinase n=1 Tax=Caulobacter segnis TaxID=88688 RepID=A0ABY4ZN64_9CAUL|nr:PAS domain-containing sensor histidine kinase [Caulobacter segnis]USQ93819.1 response regulator [Caulobacter segnis]
MGAVVKDKLWEIIGQSDRSPICAFDHDFRLIGFNQAHSDEFFRIYGYRVELGDVFPDLFLPEQAPIIRGFMARALGGEVFSVVEEFGDPSFDRPYWEIWYAPLRDEAGDIIGAFHHAQDISARLRLQVDLSAAQDALRQAQKMEAVGQLTGGIAHDFNNLLMAIVGNLQLLAKRIPEDHPGRRFVDSAASAADKGSKLTSQLLAFSRTQKLSIRSVRLDTVLDKARELVRTALPPAIAMDFVLGGQDACVLTDPDQLELAILNLALNARDAMPGGGELRVESRADGPDHLLVRVSDTGTGMTAEVARQAIEPFFTTKERGKGTGLGLAQVYGFVTQCGGALRIDSAPGAGSTIAMRLKRAEAAQTPVVEAVDCSTEPVDGEGRVVLVIDDDSSVRAVLAETLKAAGYSVVEAADGPEGLAKLDSVKPDVAVVDFLMPGMNGDEVGRRLQHALPQLPILFVSGYYDTLALDGISGAAVLRKPFDDRTLLSAVASAL